MLEYQEQKPANQEPSGFVGCVQVVTSKFVESNASVIPAASNHFTAPISITHFTLHPADILSLRHTVIVFAVHFFPQGCPLQSFVLQHTAKCSFRILHVKLCLADVLYWKNKFSFKTHPVSSDISQYVPWFTKINLFWTWLKIASKLIPT